MKDNLESAATDPDKNDGFPLTLFITIILALIIGSAACLRTCVGEHAPSGPMDPDDDPVFKVPPI